MRKMTNALVDVGKGFISLELIRNMLDVPDVEKWAGRMRKVPSSGLYLVDVEYDELELNGLQYFVPLVSRPTTLGEQRARLSEILGQLGRGNKM